MEPNRDAYVLDHVLVTQARFASRSWWVAGRPVCLQVGGSYLKPLSRFGDHAYPEDRFMGLMDDCYSAGIVRPSSYADFFNQKYRSPSVWHSVNADLKDCLHGGWEQAKTIGMVEKRVTKYDINSAYLWAITRGLPDPKSFEPSGHVNGKPGMWRVDLKEPDESLPYPFNIKHRDILVSNDEVELYSLSSRIRKVICGVTWRRQLIDTEPMVETILGLPAAKQVSRCFWGRWMSFTPIQCRTSGGGDWNMSNRVANAVWAHMTISTLKMKIWPYAKDSVHVFVDSVITDREVPTGTAIGDWRKQETYEQLNIEGPGIYGVPGQSLEKHAGRPKETAHGTKGQGAAAAGGGVDPAQVGGASRGRGV